MTILVGTITRCQGQNHYHVPVTINGSISRTIVVEQSELGIDFEEVSAKDRIVDRLRSAKKEANANTFQQTRTALEGKTFQI